MDTGGSVASTRDKVTMFGQSSYVDPNVGRIAKIGTVETALDGDDETLSRCLTAAKIDYVVGNVGQHFTHHSRELKSVMLWKAKEFTERQNEIVASITSNMDDCVNYARQTEIALADSNMEEALHSFRMIQSCEHRDAQLRGELDLLRSATNNGDVRRLCSMSEVHAAVNAFNARVNTMFNHSPSETESDESVDGEGDDNDDDNDDDKDDDKNEPNDSDKPSGDGPSLRTGAAQKGHPVAPARIEETEEQTRERLHNTTVAYLTKQPLPVMTSSNAGAASSSSQSQPIGGADTDSSSDSDEDGDMPSGLGAIVSAVESDAIVASSKANVLGAVSLISDRVERLRREQNARSERDRYRYELEADLEERMEAYASGALPPDENSFFNANPDAPEEAFLYRDASICIHSATKSILSQPGRTKATGASVQPDGASEILICRLYLSNDSQADSNAAKQSCAKSGSQTEGSSSKRDMKAAGSPSRAEETSGSKRYAMLMLHSGANGYFEFLCDCAGKSFKVVDDRAPQLACIGRPLAIQQFNFEFDEVLSKNDCVIVSVEELVNADHSKSIVVRRLKRVPPSGIVQRQVATQKQTAASNSQSTEQGKQMPASTQYVQVSSHRLNGIVQHFERMRYFHVDEFTVMLCALNRRTPSALVYNYDFVTGSLIATHVLRSGIVDLTYETDTGLLVACCTDRVLRFLTCTGVLLKEVDAAWLMNLYPSCFSKPYHNPFTAAYAPVQAVCTDDLIYVLYEYAPRPGQSADQQPNKVEQRRMLLFRGDTSFTCELVISNDALVANYRIEKIATIQRLRLAVISSSPPSIHFTRLVSSPAELISFRLYDCFERDHYESGL